MQIDLSVAIGSGETTAFDQPKATICTKELPGSRFDWIHFAPHCHGTHLEGPAHIRRGATSTLELLRALPIWHRACLIREFEHPPPGIDAFMIRKGWREGDWPVISEAWLETLPDHCLLLIDTPSVDPQWDGGKLSRHHLWFDKGGLIVELCRFPEEVEHGRVYCLLLNAAAFYSDAIPCRPVLSQGQGGMLDSACIFCKIIQGAIPSFKLLDTPLIYAFLDINPLSKGHILIIPKWHGAKLHQIPEEHLGAMLPAAKKLAQALGLQDYNLLQNNGRLAHQVLFSKYTYS